MKLKIAKNLVAVLLLSLISSIPVTAPASAAFNAAIPVPTVNFVYNLAAGIQLDIAEGNLLNTVDTPTGYYIGYSLDGGTTWFNQQETTSAQLNISFFETTGNLFFNNVASGDHDITIRFETIDGETGTSTTPIHFTVLPTPSIVSYFSTGNGIIASIANGGLLNSVDTPTGYYIDYSLDGGSTWVNHSDQQAPGTQAPGTVGFGVDSLNGFGIIQMTDVPNNPNMMGLVSITFRYENIDGDVGPSSAPFLFYPQTPPYGLEDFLLSEFHVYPDDQSVQVSFNTPRGLISTPNFMPGFAYQNYSNVSYIYTLDNGQTWSNNYDSAVFIPVNAVNSTQTFTIGNLQNLTSYDVGLSIYVPGFGPLATQDGLGSAPLILSETATVTPDLPINISPVINSIRTGNGYLEVDVINPQSATTFDFSINGGLTWTTISPAHPWLPLTIFGLTNGVEYQVKVRARYSSGTSVESNQVAATPGSLTQIVLLQDGSENGFLQSAFAEVGIRDNGAFGSSVAPEGFHPNSEIQGCLGFRVDRQKNGFANTVGAGAPFANIDDGDFFCPGNPYEGWAIEYSNSGLSPLRNSNDGTSVTKSEPMTVVSTETTQGVRWSGVDSNQDVAVTQIARLDNNGQLLKVDVTLTNLADTALENFYYQRSVDPDNATGASDGSDNRDSEGVYNTRNSVLRGGIDGTGAQVKARFDSGAEIYLGSDNPNVRASICSPWQTTGSRIYDGLDTYANPSIENNMFLLNGCTREETTTVLDFAIALAWYFPTIAAGESVTLSFTYALTAESAALPISSATSATGVGATSTATLNGVVNASGALTAVNFEYGTSADLSGSTTIVSADQSPIDGFTNVPVSKSLTDLVRGTRYYYRVIATNATGTVTSNISTFTPVGNLGIKVRDITNLGENSATLNAQINPAGGSATNINFLVSTDPSLATDVIPYSLDDVTMESAMEDDYASVSSGLSNLNIATTYYYKLVATNEAGTVESRIFSFTTRPAPSVLVNFTPSSGSTAQLSGFVNAFGIPTTLIEFRYSLDSNLQNYVIAPTWPLTLSSTADEGVTANISGLSFGQTYYYALVAANENGTNISEIRSFRTGRAPTVRLNTPTLSGLTLSLSLSVNPNGSLTYSGFRLSTVADLSSQYEDVSSNSDPVSANEEVSLTKTLSASLNPETVYYYKAYALNEFGSVVSSIESITTSTIQTTAPTIEFFSPVSTVSRTSEIGFTVTFSRSVTGFSLTDITIGGTSTGWVLSSLSDGVINEDGSQTFFVRAVPASATVGQFEFSIAAGSVIDSFANPNDASGTASFTVIDGNTDPEPTPLSISGPTQPVTGTAGTAISAFNLTIAGNESQSATVASSTLPTGLSVSTAGRVSGTPSASGNRTTTFIVTNSLNETATTTVEFRIAAAPVVNPPPSEPPPPAPTPSVTPTPTPTPTPSVTPTPTPTPSVTPTPTPSASPTPTPTPTPSASPTPTPKPKFHLAITFATNSSVITPGQLAVIKKSAVKLKGTIKIIGFIGTSKAEKTSSLASKRAVAIKLALKKAAPKLKLVITKPTYPALTNACSKLIPKAKNQCGIIYSEG